MWDLAGGNSGTDIGALTDNRNELSQICDCILDGCMQDDLRADAIQMKAKLLHAGGDTDAALEMLSKLPTWSAQIGKEQLFERDTAEFRYWNRNNCYGLMDAVAIKLARTIRFDPSLSIMDKSERLEQMAGAFGQMSSWQDLASFSIGEVAIYEVLASMLAAETAPIDQIIRVRDKQLAAMKKLMKLAESDEILKEQIRTTYQTDDMLVWQRNRLLTSQHPHFARLREENEYMEMLDRWPE